MQEEETALKIWPPLPEGMNPDTAVWCYKDGCWGTGPYTRWVKDHRYTGNYIKHCKAAREQALELFGREIGNQCYIPKRELHLVERYVDLLTGSKEQPSFRELHNQRVEENLKKLEEFRAKQEALEYKPELSNSGKKHKDVSTCPSSPSAISDTNNSFPKELDNTKEKHVLKIVRCPKCNYEYRVILPESDETKEKICISCIRKGGKIVEKQNV